MGHWLDDNRVGGWYDLLNPLTGQAAAKLATSVVKHTTTDTVSTAVEKIGLQLDSLASRLNGSGIPYPQATWAAAQVLFETGNKVSNVAKQNNNYSGIKWINKPYQDATKGTKSPEGDYYAHFRDFAAWAKDFKRILSIGGANAPINATTLQEYVNRLAHNHYFQSSPTMYFAGLSAIVNSRTPAIDQVHQRNVETLANADTWANKWAALPTWGKVAAGAGVLFIGVKLFK